MLLAVLASVAFYAVEPMSSEKYLPAAAPTGGVAGGDVRILAARGEYESGSFVLTSDRDIVGATATWGDLVASDGSKIPASALDMKVVVCWYQQGTAWYGYYSDMTRRLLTPELLVYDEKLIKVDHKTQDDYVRCDYKDGTTDWHWMTYLTLDCNLIDYYYGFRSEWVHDAERLMPFDLAAGKYKQFWLTLGVPKDAKPGVYRGNVKVKAKGEKTTSVQQQDGGQDLVVVPIVVRVLPFELPQPATFRDVKRPFYVSFFTGPGCDPSESDRIAEDYAKHNLRNPFFEPSTSEEHARRLYDRLEKYGFDTKALLCTLPPADKTTSLPAKPSDAAWAKYRTFQAQLSNAMARVRARFGEKTVPYAYGYDEAGAEVIRAERASWRSVHEQGGRVIAATRMHNYILYALDAASIPTPPTMTRKQWCDTLHASNPDMIVGWYSDPHAGPENPDLARRQYGWQTWRNNYDMVSQYAICHNGWTEFNRPCENHLRSLTMCYLGDKQLIDTLQWEGFREAIDDIRYGTLLKQLATEALTSKDVDRMYRGRAALTWLAQVPFETSSLNALRLEMVAKILGLMESKSKK